MIEEKSGNIKLRVPHCIHEALKREAEKEGVSLNQFCLYILSMNISKAQGGNKPE